MSMAVEIQTAARGQISEGLPRLSLVDEQQRTIVCPRCEECRPMNDYAVLGMNPRYAYVLSPIFRCRQCSHLFAPRVPSAVVD